MTGSWHVKTRGPRSDEDYTWSPVGETAAPSAHQIVERGWQGRSADDLLDEERPGLLLYSDERLGLVLYATGLIPPSHPVDFRGRTIRAAILGVAPTGDTAAREQLIAVAAAALDERLAADLPVEYGTTEEGGGFTADPAAWTRFLIRTAVHVDAPSEITVDLDHDFLWPDDEQHRHSAAAQLAALAEDDRLPELHGRVIVLRTNRLARAQIHRIAPWRCLSDITDTPLNRESGPAAPPLDDVVKGVLGGLGSLARNAQGLQRRFPLFSVLLVAGVLATGVLAVWQMDGSSSAAGGGTPSPDPEPPQTTPATGTIAPAPRDDLRLVGRTPEAGRIRLTPDERLTVTWHLRNQGQVPWRGRYLSLQPHKNGPERCVAPLRTAVAETPPGRQSRISLVITATSTPGDCDFVWKMTDEKGEPLLDDSDDLTLTLRIEG